MANLLKNPGFDGAFRAWNGLEDVTVAEGWLPFWAAQRADDEQWRNQRPSFRPMLRGVDASRARSGAAAQMLTTPWATHIAGIMQMVDVGMAGQRMRLTAYGQAWSTNSDNDDQSIDPGNVRLQIGIDPRGGNNPFAPNVVWSPERLNYDLYGREFVVEAVAQNARITVFLMSIADWPKKHNDVFWDDTSLEIVLTPSDAFHTDHNVVLSITSPTRQIGTPVQVAATADRQLTNPSVIISTPAGTVEGISLGMEQGGGKGYVWRWEFSPTVAGPYTVTFRSDEVPAVNSTIEIDPPLVTPVSGFAASPSGVRGRPRTQYHRVYLLLPPNTDGAWLKVVLESKAVLQNRWTVGFSADDAGMGDLDSRTVIVLNPSAWPDPILPWLQMWYPGVVVYPITAATPRDLQVILESLTLDRPELG